MAQSIRQAEGWEKITHLTVKELASSIYKELLQINKTSNQLFFFNGQKTGTDTSAINTKRTISM